MENDWDDTVSGLPGSNELKQGRAYLVVVRGNNVGETFAVTAPDMVIGRAAGADLKLDDEGVSRFHCRLRHDVLGIMVEDINSRNGTFRNGERVVPGMTALEEGDRLQIGTTTVLRFTYEETAESATVTDPGVKVEVRDPLTGTYSRRYFVDQLQIEVPYSLKHGNPLSLLLIHIDRYTEIVSAQGQAFADQITTSVAGHILGNIRDEDVIARLANGEFALMSRSASPGDTFMLAERLRKSSGGLSVPATAGPQKITLSLAVASVNELRVESANDLLIAAGTALHRARTLGGDRVVLCTQDLLREPKDRVTKV